MKKKILFITSTRLGDAVLSMGILWYLKQRYADSEITVACGPIPVSLFENGSPADHIIAMPKKKYNGHWFALWKMVGAKRWDIVVDLRDSFVSRVLMAKKRFIWGQNNDPEKHKVEQNAQVLKLDLNSVRPPAPKLVFTDEIIAKAKEIIPDGPNTIAIGPAANWKGKTWRGEYFIELINRLRASIDQGGILPDAKVVIIAAPGEEDQAQPVLDSLPDGYGIDCIAKFKPDMAAAVMQQCALYIGNDSGLMHCAVASGIPTLGLFGPSKPNLYRPWGVNADYVSTPETLEELIDYEGYHPDTADTLMDTLTVDMAYEGALKLWQKCQSKESAA